VIFQPKDLPDNRTKWPSIFRQIMGSPDPNGRQLDGMGAGISSLSKICLVERMTKRLDIEKEGVDSTVAIDYTFVGIGIENNEVDVAGNCGNMISAIGPYAYNAGLLSKKVQSKANGDVTVRIRNTNTQKYIDSTFKVVQGQAAVLGHYAIDGVAGTGAKIKLDFRNPYGSKTGKVLPTGNRIDTIAGYKVTCVDGANPCIFVRADDVGIDGTILPADFNKLPDKLALLESIRKAAAVAMGIAATEEQVPRTIPKIGIVSMSSTHQVLSGTTLKNSQVDIVVRFISDTQPHRAIPLTAALTVAVAARIPGTIVEQLLAPDPFDDEALTIGHASGRIQVNATMDQSKPLIPITASVYRTARRIFEGDIYWINDNKEETEFPQLDKSPERTYSRGIAFVEEMRGRDSSYLYDGSLDVGAAIVRKKPTGSLDDITVETTVSSNRNPVFQRETGRLRQLRSPARFLHPSRFLGRLSASKALPIVGTRVSALVGKSQMVLHLGDLGSKHVRNGDYVPRNPRVEEKQHTEESQGAQVSQKASYGIAPNEPGTKTKHHTTDQRAERRAHRKQERAQRRITQYERAVEDGNAYPGDARKLAGLSERARKKLERERRKLEN
jgi:2-methylaconitate cis-trans-isomerase PrpF